MDKIQAALPASPPLLIVISGYSGAGKDSVIKRLKDLGYPFHFVVTATSRAQRQGEVPGVDYHFLSRCEFSEMLSRDEFLEHALVYGEHYGVPKSQVRDALASGQDAVMRLDVQGAATLRRLVPDALLIFVSTSSEEELIRRLQARRTESPEALRRRLDTIAQEVGYIPLFDYIVINQDGQLDEAVSQIMAIIAAEKCRVRPRVVSI